MPPLRLLFICSRNQWRSPTGEALYRKEPDLAVRSAGTSSRARRKVSAEDLRWADLVLVMENKHRDRLRANFRAELQQIELQVLDIEDRYHFMDPQLIDELRAVVDPILEDYR